MSHRQPIQAYPKPWVEWFAHRIDDPITRLKFLQAVTPLALPRTRKAPIRRLWLAALLFPVVVGSLLLIRASADPETSAIKISRPPIRPAPVPPATKVWQVEKSADSETYSNGLRIDTRFQVASHPRSFLAFGVDQPDNSPGVRRNQPAGIVFHTTESHQAPFEAGANSALKRIGESLLDFVRRNHAYHFLIDRFGRVYRIVIESDAANHAGYSVWSDDEWYYLNLNQSFLGISFEAQTQAGQLESSVSPAQVRSAAMLIEMLRNRYSLSASNCVTHAQVSVNPDNMRVGYHTDWASSFPFQQLGLPDNYGRALPALTAFGFEYDATFLRWAGTRLYAGVESAEEELARNAGASGVTPIFLRRMLKQRYRLRLAEVRRLNAGSEESEGSATR
jgi:hypothetical protein